MHLISLISQWSCSHPTTRLKLEGKATPLLEIMLSLSSAFLWTVLEEVALL
jgi:hypothetical protein